MKKLLFACFLLQLFYFKANSTIVVDSLGIANSTLSLLYFQEGGEIYTTWGHLALRLKDSINKTDILFNFGTFDFNDPNFVWKFLKGDLLYFLSVENYQSYIHYYRNKKRGLKELIFDIDYKKKAKIIQSLVSTVNNDPYYHYNFIYNNCATRIVDLIIDSINLNDNNIDLPLSSFREAIVYYPKIVQNSFLATGINILLGAETDKKLKMQHYGFLPPLFYFQLLQFKNIILNLAENTIIPPKFYVFNDINIIILILILIICWIIYLLTTHKINKLTLISKIIIYIEFFIGILILFLWLFCQHQACKNNYNILWANPLNLTLLFISKKNYIFYKILSYLMICFSLIYIIIAIDLSQYSLDLWLLNFLNFLIGFYYWRTVKKSNNWFKLKHSFKEN